MAKTGSRGADKYIEERGVFRERAKAQFLAKPHALELVATVNDYVAGTMFAVSGENMTAASRHHDSRAGKEESIR